MPFVIIPLLRGVLIYSKILGKFCRLKPRQRKDQVQRDSSWCTSNMHAHHHHHRSAAEQATTSFLQPQRSCANSDSLPGPIMLSVSPKRCWMYLRNRVRCLPVFLFPCGGIYSAYSLHACMQLLSYCWLLCLPGKGYTGGWQIHIQTTTRWWPWITKIFNFRTKVAFETGQCLRWHRP